MATIFTRIASGEIPSYKVAESEDFYAFLDINPLAKGHTLVIPKAQSAGLLDTPDAALGEMVARVRKVAARLKEVLRCDGFNILQNNGEAAGQTVMHVHFHIVPRYAGGEALSFKSGKGDMEALKALAERLRF